MVKPEKFGHLHLVYYFSVPSSMHDLLLPPDIKGWKGVLEIFKE